LNRKVRAQQLQEVRELIDGTPGEAIFLGDFNILGGFKELEPLLHNDLVLLSSNEQPTFTFHLFRKVLDICICTRNIAPHCHLRVIPQPYSDHAALVLEIDLDATF
jgi:endonuclease/exonuclease/phosphatase family metal-dependent hydrolase